uniref:Uncharacterized protein n=1 Tax=Candidatus Methanogaster sp. ANME-2c ERB4 TaxID=2759911 RepID=A0A7G9YHG8_9EURY|nr:hypothetical protein IILFPGFB_00024 [Methanosarcinales archaeon ANME-2c ERB4]
MGMVKGVNPAFQHREYLFRRKVFKLFGGAFHVYDTSGNVLFYSKQKAFKLKEDFRIYSDESMSQELLSITTPQILDIGATYNIRDATTGEAVGALRRKGLKSIIKDEWVILSKEGQEIGIVAESSMITALLSRFIGLIPQTYVVRANGQEVAEIKQHFNPFVLKYTMTISDVGFAIDPRLLIATGILLVGIEGRQK